MRSDDLTDLEKQELLQLLFANNTFVSGAERLATRLAESISSEDQRRVAIAMTSRYLATLGKITDAADLVERNLEGAASATEFAAIAAELARTDHSEARSYVQKALDALKKIGAADDRVRPLQALVEAYLSLGEKTRARYIANQISPPADRAYTLAKVMKVAWDEGDKQEAEKLILETRATAFDTERFDRADALDDLAKTLAHMNRKNEALSLWEEALKFVDESLDPPKLRLIICKGLASIGEHKRARQVAESITNEARRAQALAAIGDVPPGPGHGAI